ncbi:hypothetical protein HanPI659440_Chr08g0283811 [Helianthus annuus]|nr:hypothetical protein HanPI659440_Chr08g0283811 [Helianthus annuus]
MYKRIYIINIEMKILLHYQLTKILCRQIQSQPLTTCHVSHPLAHPNF